MGVRGLWELLAPVGRRVSVETLAGKRLAIVADVSIWMVQFIKAMKDEKSDMVSVFDGGTPALKRRTVIARRRQRENAQTKIRKTAEKLLLNRLKEMRLKEQPNDLKKQRLQLEIRSVYFLYLWKNLCETLQMKMVRGGSCFQEEKMDEISSASVAGETVNDFATKGSSVTTEKIQGGIDIR
uniref:XPG N-terminal domain-containing protein n=1 Tax=Brassica oleracea TaxID=3712 RepID=A0A3P6EPQ2_BRAOL|nr:unnamed protein product [Brassica oleracea]